MESAISEKEHQLLLDAIKDHAIFMMDTGGQIISWNEGAKRLKGWEDHEVMGQHYALLYLPEDRNGRPEHALKVAFEQGRFEEEWWRLKKDGSKFWAHVILQPVYDEKKNHVGFAKITTDRTLQKRVDELNGFLMNEVSGYAIFLLDKNGRIAKWSKAAQSILGYEESEVLGKSMTIFHAYNTNNDNNLDLEQRLRQADGKFESEGWNRKKDGGHFWASFLVSPLLNGDGFVVLMRDLTENKAYDQTLKTNIALTASNDALERFAYVVSHDLKEPIRKITTYCHLLQADNKRQENFLTKILNACSRVNNLIDDILKFSTLSGEYTFENHSLNDILSNTLESLSEAINEKNAIVEVDELPPVRVNPSQMEQLFQNLLSNAIKFSRPTPQRPAVSVSHTIVAREDLADSELSTMFPSDYYIRINVKDNGIGFSQEHADNIFNLFHRLHAKEEFEGTGVGLAICKKVVENHGGNIRAFSKEGDGALFVITLPYTT